MTIRSSLAVLATVAAIGAGPAAAITPLSCQDADRRRSELAVEEGSILAAIARERRRETPQERERLASVRRIRAFLLVCGPQN